MPIVDFPHAPPKQGMGYAFDVCPLFYNAPQYPVHSSGCNSECNCVWVLG